PRRTGHRRRDAGRRCHLLDRVPHVSPRILLVDDEANIRKMVGALLQSEGFETAEAGNGTAALAAVERGAPDAVLLDLMMPGGPDGLATLEQLKRVAPDVPVVMMSGKASLTDAVRATKLGAFQFLEKPLTPEGLLVAIRGALELAGTSGVPSPEPPSGAWVASSWPTAARCSSTRWGTSDQKPKQNCCASWSREGSSGWAARNPSRWTCA